MLEIKDKGVFKVVDASSLESWTSMGWHLVAVLENETALPWSDSENFATSSSTPVYNNMGQQLYGNMPSGYITASNTRYHPQKSQSFLLQLGEESLIAELQARVLALESDLAGTKGLEKRLGETEKSRDDALKRVQEITDIQARTVEQLNASNKALVDYKTEVAEKMKHAEEIILKDRALKKTAYERVVEGGFDDEEALEVVTG